MVPHTLVFLPTAGGEGLGVIDSDMVPHTLVFLPTAGGEGLGVIDSDMVWVHIYCEDHIQDS